jgi:hypothetical protein
MEEPCSMLAVLDAVVDFELQVFLTRVAMGNGASPRAFGERI